ncbi:MAG: SH3 domain-containing protein [Chloroflexi bacterium]|nr:MAG: SH3 domain-containing protein [Chloroflexota bacterium]
MDDTPDPHANPERYPPAPQTQTGGMVYRSPGEDNRRTTQQVLLPRRSGIHAVMQRGPRLAIAIGLVVAIILGLSTYASNAGAVDVPASNVLPTLTVNPAADTIVVVVGTGASGLFLRSEPRRDADILQTLPDGTVLTVAGAQVNNDGSWLPVVTGAGISGWVAANYTQAK